MTSKKELQAPWLPAPVWKDFPMTKGLGHHRAAVGIIVAANEKVECILESKSLDQVQVRLLNDDRKTEGRFVVKSSQPGRASTFSVGSVSVPFVDGDYLKKTPEEKRTISIRYPSNSKTLPIYHFGDNEDEFFKLWDTQNAEFAYVESDYFGLLIPKIDKEATRKLPGGKHLDDLIVFYDDILTTYSQLIGLSFEESGTNQNVKNRFFIKADKNGFGAAYYDHSYTAVNSGSIKSFWLDIGPTNWGALHEIGHGHELKSLNDETLSVGEVWNNILAFFYQTIKFGKDYSKRGSQRRNMNIVEVLRKGAGVRNWGLFEKLSFLVHMFFKAGQQSFTRFNQLTRQEFAGNPYYASGTLLVEKLMHFFAIDFEIDVYPFMKLAKAVIREDQLLEHYYVLSSVAYPLNYLVSDAKVINTIIDKLSLPFETSLVTPSDLSSTKLKNDFTVKIDSKIFDVISGDMLKLMDGSRIVVEEKILSQTIVLKNIPIGVYKVFVEPNRKNTKLAYDDFYAVVHASQSNELLLSGKETIVPSLSPDKLKFLALGDGHFATLTASPFKKLLNFKFFSKNPHAYFKDQKYASISIRNQKSEVIFSKSIDGNSTALVSQDINMGGQLEIEIFHAETKGRLKFEEPLMDAVIDRNNKTNYFIVNELGFQNKNITTPKDLLDKNFLKKIEFVADKIRKKISLFVRPHCQPKYNLLLAIEAYERLFNKSSVSKKLREQYKDCLPKEDAF